MGNVIEKKVNIDVGFKADESGLDALSKRIESKLRELQENGKLDLQVSNIKNIDKLLGTFSKLDSALTSIKQEGRSAGEALKQAFGKVMSGDLAKATANFNKFGKQSLSFMNRLNGIGKDIGTKDVSNRIRNLAKDINGAFKEMGSKAPLDIDKLMGKSVQEQMNALTKSTMRFTTEWTKNIGTINLNPKVDVKPNVQAGEVKNDITKAVQNAAPDSVKTDVKVQVNPDVEVWRLKEALREIYGHGTEYSMGDVVALRYKGIIADVQAGAKTAMQALKEIARTQYKNQMSAFMYEHNRNESLSGDYEKAAAQVRAYEEQIERLKTTMKGLQDSSIKMTGSNDALKAEIQEYSAMVDKLEQEKKELVESMKSMGKEATPDFSGIISALQEVKAAIQEIRAALEPMKNAFSTEGTAIHAMAQTGATSLDSLMAKLKEFDAILNAISKKNFSTSNIFNMKSGSPDKTGELEAYRAKAQATLDVIQDLVSAQSKFSNTNSKAYSKALGSMDTGKLSQFLTTIQKFDNINMAGKIAGADTVGKIQKVVAELERYKQELVTVSNLINKVKPGAINMAGLGELDKMEQKIKEASKSSTDKLADTLNNSFKFQNIDVNTGNIVQQFTVMRDQIEAELNNIKSLMNATFDFSNVTVHTEKITSAFNTLAAEIEKIKSKMNSIEVSPTVQTGAVKTASNLKPEASGFDEIKNKAQSAAQAKDQFVAANRNAAASASASSGALSSEASGLKNVGNAAQEASHKMEAMAKNQTINLKTLAGLEKSTKRAFEGYSGTHDTGKDLTKQYNDWLNQIDKIRSARRKMTEEEYQNLRTGGVAIQNKIAQLKEENAAIEQLNRQLEMYSQYQQRLNKLNGFLDPANTKNLLGTKYEDQIKQSIDRIKGSVGKFDLQIFNKEELAVETRYLDQMFASTERLVAKARDAQGQTAFGGSLEKQFASIERAAERIKALQQGIRTVGSGGLEIVDPTAIQKIEQYKTALDQLNAIRAKLQSKSTASITGDEINEWNKAREAVEKYQRELTQLLETSHKLATKGETKKMLGDTSDLKARTKEMEAYAQAMQHGSLVSSKMSSDMRTLTANINDGAGRIHSVTVKFDEATQSMTRFASGSKSTLTGWQQFTSQLTGKVKDFSSYMLTFVSFYDAIRVIKSGVKQVTEIDAALTELKKVTDETDASYSNFLNTASKTATQVGSTIRDIVSSTADYARLGYSMNDAADLAANTAKLMNVSEFENISDATDSMISIMQAFRSQMSGDIGKDSMQVIDMLNEVGNNYAISSDEIATSLMRSSAAMQVANNDLAQTIALTAAANTTIQNPESVGHALKTVSMRIRGMTTELKEEGEETDGVAESTSKLRDQVLALTNVNGKGGFDILTDTGDFKATYDVIVGIGKVWKQMNDTDQAALLDLIAGKNRGSVIAALLDDSDLIESAYKSAIDSAGSADEEFAKQQKSIEGHVNQLKNTWQTMWNDSLNSNAVKFFVDLAKAIVKVVDVAGILPTIFTTISGITLWKNRDMLKMNFKEALGGSVEADKMANAITRVQNVMQSGQASVVAYANAVKVLSAEQQAQVLTEQGLTQAQVAAALAKNQVAEADTVAAAAANAAKVAKLGLEEAEISEAFAAETANVAKQQQILTNMELLNSEGQLDVAKLKALVVNGQLSTSTAELIMSSQGYSAEMIKETGILEANTAAKERNAMAEKQAAASKKMAKTSRQFDFMAAYGGYGDVVTDSFKKNEVAATGFFAKLKAGGKSLKASISQLSALSKVMLGFNVALIGFQVVSGIINHFIQKEEEAYQAAQKAAQEYQETAQSVSDYRAKIQELKESLASGSLSQQEAYNTRKQLLDLQGEMISKYGAEAGAINVLTSSVEQANAAFDELEAKQARQYLRDNAKDIAKATDYMNVSGTNTMELGDSRLELHPEIEWNQNVDRIGTIMKQVQASAKKYGITIDGSGAKLKLQVTGTALEKENALNSFMEDLQSIATENSINVDDIFSLDEGELESQVTSALNNMQKVTKKWKDQYDAAAEAEIKADPDLASRVNQLQDIYSKIQEAQSAGASREVYDNVINWARAMGDVGENILNNDNVSQEVKAYVQNMINEIESTMSQQKLEISMALDFKQKTPHGEWIKSLISDFKDEFGNALGATDVQDIGASWMDKQRNIQTALSDGNTKKAEEIKSSFTEQEQAYEKLTQMAREYGVSVDEVLSAWISLGRMAPGSGFLSKDLPDWSTETLAKNVDEYKTVQENVNKTVIDGQKISDGYYDSLNAYLLGVTVDGKKFSDVVDKENGNIVKNAKLIRQMISVKRQDTQATINSAKAHAMLNYGDLTKDLQKQVGIMAKDIKAKGEVKAATLANVDALMDQIDAVKATMREYALLELQVSELTDGFREFEAAQARDQELTYGDSMVAMLNTLNEGFQKGTVGSEAFQAAVKALVPESAYADAENYTQKLDEIYDYLDNDPHFADYFTVDDNGIEITGQNIKNLLDDCEKLGLVAKQTDGSFEWTDANIELDDVADKLGITKEAAVALFTEASKYDGTWSNSLSEILSNAPDRAINNTTEALENAVNEQKQFILDGGNVESDKYTELAKKTDQAADALKKAKQAAADNAGQWNQSEMLLNGFMGQMQLTSQTATQLARNLGLIGETETIQIEDGKVVLTNEQVQQLNANKQKLSEPSTVDIQMNYNEINSQITELESKIKEAKDSGKKEIDFGNAKISTDEAESKLATLKAEAQNIEVTYDVTKAGDDPEALVTKLGSYELNGITIPIKGDASELESAIANIPTGDKTINTYFNVIGGDSADEAKNKVEGLDKAKVNNKSFKVSDGGTAASCLSKIYSLDRAKISDKSFTITRNEVTKKKTINEDSDAAGTIWANLEGPHAVHGTVSKDSTPAHVTGTARLKGQLNGLEEDEQNAIVGELGPELVVDPYRGKYYTVGDNGTEMIDLPKGAIIYNHKQTEELLRQGKTSRGHLKGSLKLSDGISMAQGNAHSYTPPYTKGGFTNGSGTRPTKNNNKNKKNDKSQDKAVKATNNAAKATNKAAKATNNAAKATKKAADEFSEFIDWIDVLFTRLDNTIAEQEAILENKLSNIESIAKKTENYNKIMEKYAQEQTYSLQAAKKYQALANEKMSGLSQDIVTKIKNGSIDVTEYKDEDTVNKINEALDYLAKVSDYTKKSEESLTQIAETAKAQFEAQQQAYENQSSGAEHMNNMYESSSDILEAKMGFKTAKLMEQQIKQQQKLLDLYTQERKQLNETLILMVKAGRIKMGSQQWYDMKSAIEEVDEKILDAESSIEEFKNSLNDLHWDLFDELINRFNYVGDEISNVISLLDHKTDSLVKQDNVGALTSKKNWATDEGITTIGLYAQEMERAQYVAKQYAKAITELKSDYASGKYNETEYLSKLNELISGQYESIEKYYDARDAIVELNEARVDAIKDGIDKEVDAYTKLINKKKELLDAEKD